MDADSHSTSTSGIASALASGTTSPATGLIPVNPKSGGLLEAAVPMVIVQQFIEDNKEKGMPGNQTMADLKEKKKAFEAEKEAITKELKNEERKRSRLRNRTNTLSGEDLVQVLAIRASAASVKKAKQNEVDLAASGKKQLRKRKMSRRL